MCASSTCLKRGHSSRFTLSKYVSRLGTRRRVITSWCSCATRIMSISPTQSLHPVTDDCSCSSTAAIAPANSSRKIAWSVDQKSAQNKYSDVAVSIRSLCVLRNTCSGGSRIPFASTWCTMSGGFVSRSLRTLARFPSAKTEAPPARARAEVSSRPRPLASAPKSDEPGPAAPISGPASKSFRVATSVCSRPSADTYDPIACLKTRPIVSTYAARTSTNTSGPWSFRNAVRCLNFISTCC
mmetsp:Transcript_2474/g.9085  ORF Transcript_2474/g.9085 Transcript_2474/m.9085 type:complete len:240 (+) Transcript_2474:778-1497(+)